MPQKNRATSNDLQKNVIVAEILIGHYRSGTVFSTSQDSTRTTRRQPSFHPKMKIRRLDSAGIFDENQQLKYNSSKTSWSTLQRVNTAFCKFYHVFLSRSNLWMLRVFQLFQLSELIIIQIHRSPSAPSRIENVSNLSYAPVLSHNINQTCRLLDLNPKNRGFTKTFASILANEGCSVSTVHRITQ